MSKSGRSAPPQTESPPGEAPTIIETLLIAAVAMLLVWRILSPTEGATLGLGLWMAQFSFAALVLWSLGYWRRKVRSFQFHKVDIAVALFVTGHLISGLLALTGDANQRATINMLAEWAGLGATYFLMRQTFTTWDIRRQIVVILLASSAALAGYGLWQHYVWYPQTAAQYKEIRGKLDELSQQPTTGSNVAASSRLKRQLIEMGVPTGSLEGSGRMGYEARLLSSTEPLGRFALANTFAGLLAVWLIVLLAVLAQRFANSTSQPVPIAHWVCGIGLALLIAACLLLTKSRTAYVGTMVGGVAIFLSMITARTTLPRHTWRIVIAAVLVIAGLVTAMVMSGGLDRWVVAETRKSLGYRLEYWQGTWDVIRTHPLVGIGPGNFRNHYLQYKRPESSEEISDPHNALLDVWVNGGLISVVGLAAMAVLCIVTIRRSSGRLPDQLSDSSLEPAKQNRKSQSQRPAGQIMIPVPQASTWGAFLAFCVVGATEFSAVTWCLLAVWCVAMPLAGKAIGLNSPRPAVFLIAAATLMVHLSGAGGIAMPALCQMLLLCVALILPPAEAPTSARSLPRWAGIAALVLSLGISIACWQFATAPVSRASQLLAEGDYQLWERGNPVRARQAYLAATVADPYAGESWRKLAELELGGGLAKSEETRETVRKATEMLRKSLEKNPRSWNNFRILGEYYLQANLRLQSPELAGEAVAAFSSAVELYPNSAEIRGRLAEALFRDGRVADAQREARFALQLNETTQQAGHVDRVLPEKTLELLRKMANQADAPVPPSESD
ncbi:O-Antigen ligase [Symmachiella dynata]|uniref:O-antigen ligase family protein n=1 Tax=Symmachiella dynata TaxID=2527995 RepID=UPI00118D5110|nr:O-antigen ligase family protein [Symmachiella dynata]QDT50827.1 O-Antigen ligase [Symmachiella dynata]